MKKYIVGGWVRDKLLQERGFAVRPSDRDWVVIGATPEEMICQGYTPVGKDFPVFLHPKTHEEYALARTERKSGNGYKGFVFYTASNVTLEQDLYRRDLTVNAIAMDENGHVTDPYGGCRDLEAKVLRNVSDAFKEDPVRVLRAARFAAKLPDFTIADETKRLLRSIVESGETDYLVAERVGRELMKALHEAKPSRFFEVLKDCGYLSSSFPKWRLTSKTMDLTDAADDSYTESERFALLFLDTDPSALGEIFKLLRVSSENEDLALQFSRTLHGAELRSGSAEEVLESLKRKDALRRPKRFASLMKLLESASAIKDQAFWLGAAEALMSVDMKAAAEVAEDRKEIPQAIRAASLKAIEAYLKEFADQH